MSLIPYPEPYPLRQESGHKPGKPGQSSNLGHERLAFMAVCVLLAEPRPQKAGFHGLVSEFSN